MAGNTTLTVTLGYKPSFVAILNYSINMLGHEDTFYDASIDASKFFHGGGTNGYASQFNQYSLGSWFNLTNTGFTYQPLPICYASGSNTLYSYWYASR